MSDSAAAVSSAVRPPILVALISAVVALGVGVTPAQAVDTQMAIDTTSIDFGDVEVGNTSPPLQVTLINTGGDDFGPIAMFGGAPPTPEFVAGQSCQGATLAPGGSCIVIYTFAPQSPGSFIDTSSFTISETANQADGEGFAVSLAGVGVNSIGLSTEGAQWFDNVEPTSPHPNDGDQFGRALATGDFNGDGADDLATGIPNDRDDNDIRSGSVVIRYGSRASGLVGGAVTTVLRQEPQSAGDLESFGSALAAGDFNGDSFDDLAVGIPFNQPGIGGAVRVYYGTSAGIQILDYEHLDEVSAGEPDHICPGVGDALFGFALTAGSFDGDPYEDLAIGAPRGCERVSPTQWISGGGSLFVAHGSADGLLPFFGYRISQNSFGIFDDVENGDRFGYALAAGDFNADGYDDLAIGVPREDDVGAIEIIMGSQWGLIFANSVFWLPGALGEVPEVGDELGSCLASGDFDGDGFADLAIGSPFEDLGLSGRYDATGSINVAYGAADPNWFDLSRTDHLAQSTIYGDEIHEGTNDLFGSAFGVGDFDGDGRGDLAIGHPGDDWAGQGLGAVTVLMGATPTIGHSTRYDLLAIGREGVPGDASQPNQSSGSALAVGDFDGSGRSDLAIGVPLYDNGGSASAGGEAVLYSERRVFADGFEIGSTDRWSTVHP